MRGFEIKFSFISTHVRPGLAPAREKGHRGPPDRDRHSCSCREGANDPKYGPGLSPGSG